MLVELSVRDAARSGVRKVLLTMKLRLRDKHAVELNRQSRAVNFVWNYCNETQQKAARDGRKWLSGYDLEKLTAGSSVDLGLHSASIKEVCQQHARARSTHRKPWLRFRGRKSLGWVPFKKKHVHIAADGKLIFRGVTYETMHWRSLPGGAVVHAGSFNQDSRGRWYINMPVEFPASVFDCCEKNFVGIDLGLKHLVTLSTGSKIRAPQFYRQHEQRLGNAQRAKKRRLSRNIGAKIANCRKDHLHKVSTQIALAHNIIVVGKASIDKLTQTNRAKSIFDAGWSTLRKQLSYKALRHGGTYIEVSEAYTTQVCSSCGDKPEGRPQGIAGLGIRQWTCGGCGAVHDRDVNAARNIARLGLETLDAGART